MESIWTAFISIPRSINNQLHGNDCVDGTSTTFHQSVEPRYYLSSMNTWQCCEQVCFASLQLYDYNKSWLSRLSSIPTSSPLSKHRCPRTRGSRHGNIRHILNLQSDLTYPLPEPLHHSLQLRSHIPVHHSHS